MLMPFGKHEGKELNTLPDSYLRWILREIKAEAPSSVRPENREHYVKVRLTLRQEASRILRERARNGVTVKDPDAIKHRKFRY